MPLRRDEVEQLLSSGSFGGFVGEIESETFDAKSQPYPVASDSGKLELAKDVAALSNANGGYIVIGLHTKQSTVHYADEIEAVRPLSQTLVNTQQYRNIVDGWIYPRLEGLDVRFYGAADDAARGLVAIHVPQQRHELKPFLLARTFDGSRFVETVFGYVVRKGDANSSLSKNELQAALGSGLNFETKLSARLDRLEALITSLSTARSDAKDESAAKVEERVKRALSGGSSGRTP